MEELCPGCLCSGRKLNSIKETSVYYFYKQIVDEVAAPEELPQLSKVCWECAALLQKFQCFQQQVKCCYLELFMCLQQNSEQSLSKPSHLQCQLAVVISYPEVKADVEIKVETDEVHCEPETFVNGLTWGHNLEKNVPCVHENVTKQLNKKQSKENQSGKTKKKQKRKILKKKTKLKKELSESDHDFEDIETDFQIEPMDMKLDQKEKYIDESEMNVDESNVNFDQSELVNVTKEETDQFETEQNETSQAEMDDDVVEKVINVRSREQLPERPQCVECGKIFSSRKTYRYHLNVLHKGQNRHPCPKCGKVYQWKSNLGRHMRSHKARESGELYCVKCDKSFASVATYRQHIRISRRHVSESEFTFTCDECGKKFVSKTRLRDHVDWEHLNKIKFRCQLCNKPFKCHTSLYVHLQNVHRNKERRDNLCHVCGKSYQITQKETNSEENNFSPSDESDVDPNSSYISDDDINTEDEYYDDQLVKKQMHGNKRKCEKNIQKDKSRNTVSRRKKLSDNIQFNEVEVVAPEMQEGDEVVSAEIQIESPEGVSPEIQTESPEGVSPEIQKDSCEHRHNYKKMGKRRWDRRNACFYCQELVTNYSRHLLRKHPNEIEVIKYKSINDVDLKVRKQKRQEITNKLRNKGNFSHNLKVCFDRDGEKTLLPVRRNTQESSPSAFTTCKICLGTFKRSTFYKHFKKCGAND